jgi:outer membrane receptor protein involved in Fe transport
MRLVLLYRTLAWLILALIPCICMAESASSQAVESNDFPPIERLLETEFIPASRIANQVSDASSAVSIVTAQDIKDYGYRTLADILNSMRGLNVTQDYQYQYLGGRGYGIPQEYAMRISLLIDGYRAADSYFGQALLGNEGFLDVALIDRVEYIPGSGSNGYGDGAMLAAINIITKKGADINGTQASVGYGSHNTQQERVTFGKQLANGADILLSASTYNSKGRNFSFPESSVISAGSQNGANGEDNDRLFFKGSYQDWSVESAWVKRHIDTPSAPFSGEYGAPLPLTDNSGFAQLKYDAEFAPHLKLSTQVYFGQYLLHQTWDHLGTLTNVASRWHGVDAKFVADWFDRHTLVFGAEYKHDSAKDLEDGYDTNTGDHYHYINRDQRKTYSLYAYDNIALTNKLNLNLGGRYEASDNGMHMFNPRLALIYKPREETTLKLSMGETHRQATPFESAFPEVNSKQPERVHTTELVWEEQLGWQTRLIGSLYHYKIDSRIMPQNDPPDITTNGAEIEFEKQWDGGTRLRASYAKQYARNAFGDRPLNSPHDNVKLNLTMPMIGEKLRAGFAARYIGDRRVVPGYAFTGGYTVADLTFTSANIVPNVNASLSIRNLFDRAYGDVIFPDYSEQLLFPKDRRNLWLQLEYTFK